MKGAWASFRENPLGWVMGIVLIAALSYIIVSLLVENAELRQNDQQQDNRFLELVTQKQGLPGLDGDSAYDIAVDNGFVGTEVEWLASLKGERGEAGTPGIDGRDGSNGSNGAAGANGLSVSAPVCVGGTQYKWYLTNGTYIGATKAICLP